MYRRELAVAYANLWWDKKNPRFLYFGDEDCTNYVSQSLLAGGAPMRYGKDRAIGWWYRFGKEASYSYSWAVAHSLKNFLEKSRSGLRGIPMDDPRKLEPGDVICYDFDGDGRWQHNAIVVGMNEGGEPLVNTHSYNRTGAHWALRDSPALTGRAKYAFLHIVV